MTVRLDITGLRASHGPRAVLHGLDLRLDAGECVALLGPNGAGKTTLLHAIAGVHPLSAGHVCVDGHDLRDDLLGARRSLGLAVAQTLLPERLTGRECLALFAGARGLAAVPASSWELCELLQLTPMLDRHVSHYSLGTRQKLGIALGLLGTPPLLLLDEPVNGLDPLSAHALKQHLRERADRHGDTILLATHALDVAERVVDRAVLLVDGHLRHQWDRSALDALRRDPERSLESDMVAVLTAQAR